MKLFMIAKNNIKKSRSEAATLFILVVLSTILLYVGCNVLLQLDSFLDEKNEILNGSDVTVITRPQFENDVIDTMKGMEGYSYSESEPCILYTSPKMVNLDLKEKEQSIAIMIQNMDEERKVSKVNLIDESKKKYENSIILPYILKSANGYRTGDQVQIKYNDRIYVYKIYGFYEDIMFSNPTNVSTYKVLLFDNCFNNVMNEAEESLKYEIIQTTLKVGADSETFEARFIEKAKESITNPNFTYQSLNFSTMKVGTLVFINIIMVVFIAFSFIILVIALVVIRFTIVTHIESNIQNIGAMEAIGYTSSQMIRSILLEFLIISVLGWMIGILLSFVASPIITNLVASTIGLAWKAKVDGIAVLVSCITILALIAIISYLTARRMKKITPLVALRSGIQTHNFKKNYLPLDKTKLNLNVSIGLKVLLQNKKQNILITTIVIMLSFACVFASAMYYNFAENNVAMLKLIGIETADISFECDRRICDKAFSNIKEMNGVERILKLQNINTTLYSKSGEESVNVNVCEDYRKLDINTVVKGRYPIHDNEIAVTNLTLKKLKSKLGDTISIEYNGEKKEYLVVGVTQQIAMLGKCANITEAGMKRINKDFILNNAVIYLQDNVSVTSFINRLNCEYSGENIEVVNNKETLDSMLLSFNNAITILCISCIIISSITVVLILFLLVRVKILKERMQLGVSKALGYTTSQLIIHEILSFLPIIVVGTVIGAVLGYFGTNPAVTLLLASNGILNCNFIVNITYVMAILLGITMIAFLTILIVAFRIRKITPYELFTNSRD